MTLNRVYLPREMSYSPAPSSVPPGKSSIADPPRVFGVVIYNGDSTKIMQRLNCHPSRSFKKGSLDRDIDLIVTVLSILVLLLASLSFLILAFDANERSFDIYLTKNDTTIFALKIFQLLMIYIEFVPLGIMIVTDLVVVIFRSRIQRNSTIAK